MIKPELSLIALGPAEAQFRLQNYKLILHWLSHLVATLLIGTCDFRVVWPNIEILYPIIWPFEKYVIF